MTVTFFSVIRVRINRPSPAHAPSAHFPEDLFQEDLVGDFALRALQSRGFLKLLVVPVVALTLERHDSGSQYRIFDKMALPCNPLYRSGSGSSDFLNPTFSRHFRRVPLFPVGVCQFRKTPPHRHNSSVQPRQFRPPRYDSLCAACPGRLRSETECWRCLEFPLVEGLLHVWRCLVDTPSDRSCF